MRLLCFWSDPTSPGLLGSLPLSLVCFVFNFSQSILLRAVAVTPCKSFLWFFWVRRQGGRRFRHKGGWMGARAGLDHHYTPLTRWIGSLRVPRHTSLKIHDFHPLLAECKGELPPISFLIRLLLLPPRGRGELGSMNPRKSMIFDRFMLYAR